jgi:hypothetical protein
MPGLYFDQQRRKQTSVRGIAQVGTMVRTVFMTSREGSRFSVCVIAQVGTMVTPQQGCILTRREGGRSMFVALLRLVQW